MKTVIRLEQIGDDFYWQQKTKNLDWATEFKQLKKYGDYRVRAWVAKITSVGFDKVFIRGNSDYSECNRDGSRGIFTYYVLENGLYEINERVSYKKTDRYLLLVDGENRMRVTKQEAEQWLIKNISA